METFDRGNIFGIDEDVQCDFKSRCAMPILVQIYSIPCAICNLRSTTWKCEKGVFAWPQLTQYSMFPADHTSPHACILWQARTCLRPPPSSGLGALISAGGQIWQEHLSLASRLVFSISRRKRVFLASFSPSQIFSRDTLHCLQQSIYLEEVLVHSTLRRRKVTL